MGDKQIVQKGHPQRPVYTHGKELTISQHIDKATQRVWRSFRGNMLRLKTIYFLTCRDKAVQRSVQPTGDDAVFWQG